MYMEINSLIIKLISIIYTQTQTMDQNYDKLYIKWNFPLNRPPILEYIPTYQQFQQRINAFQNQIKKAIPLYKQGECYYKEMKLKQKIKRKFLLLRQKIQQQQHSMQSQQHSIEVQPQNNSIQQPNKISQIPNTQKRIDIQIQFRYKPQDEKQQRLKKLNYEIDRIDKLLSNKTKLQMMGQSYLNNIRVQKRISKVNKDDDIKNVKVYMLISQPLVKQVLNQRTGKYDEFKPILKQEIKIHQHKQIIKQCHDSKNSGLNLYIEKVYLCWDSLEQLIFKIKDPKNYYENNLNQNSKNSQKQEQQKIDLYVIQVYTEIFQRNNELYVSLQNDRNIGLEDSSYPLKKFIKKLNQISHKVYCVLLIGPGARFILQKKIQKQKQDLQKQQKQKEREQQKQKQKQKEKQKERQRERRQKQMNQQRFEQNQQHQYHPHPHQHQHQHQHQHPVQPQLQHHQSSIRITERNIYSSYIGQKNQFGRSSIDQSYKMIGQPRLSKLGSNLYRGNRSQLRNLNLQWYQPDPNNKMPIIAIGLFDPEKDMFFKKFILRQFYKNLFKRMPISENFKNTKKQAYTRCSQQLNSNLKESLPNCCCLHQKPSNNWLKIVDKIGNATAHKLFKHNSMTDYKNQMAIQRKDKSSEFLYNFIINNTQKFDRFVFQCYNDEKTHKLNRANLDLLIFNQTNQFPLKKSNNKIYWQPGQYKENSSNSQQKKTTKYRPRVAYQIIQHITDFSQKFQALIITGCSKSGKSLFISYAESYIKNRQTSSSINKITFIQIPDWVKLLRSRQLKHKILQMQREGQNLIINLGKISYDVRQQFDRMIEQFHQDIIKLRSNIKIIGAISESQKILTQLSSLVKIYNIPPIQQDQMKYLILKSQAIQFSNQKQVTTFRKIIQSIQKSQLQTKQQSQSSYDTNIANQIYFSHFCSDVKNMITVINKSKEADKPKIIEQQTKKYISKTKTTLEYMQDHQTNIWDILGIICSFKYGFILCQFNEEIIFKGNKGVMEQLINKKQLKGANQVKVRLFRIDFIDNLHSKLGKGIFIIPEPQCRTYYAYLHQKFFFKKLRYLFIFFNLVYSLIKNSQKLKYLQKIQRIIKNLGIFMYSFQNRLKRLIQKLNIQQQIQQLQNRKLQPAQRDKICDQVASQHRYLFLQLLKQINQNQNYGNSAYMYTQNQLKAQKQTELQLIGYTILLVCISRLVLINGNSSSSSRTREVSSDLQLNIYKFINKNKQINKQNVRKRILRVFTQIKSLLIDQKSLLNKTKNPTNILNKNTNNRTTPKNIYAQIQQQIQTKNQQCQYQYQYQVEQDNIDRTLSSLLYYQRTKLKIDQEKIEIQREIQAAYETRQFQIKQEQNKMQDQLQYQNYYRNEHEHQHKHQNLQQQSLTITNKQKQSHKKPQKPTKRLMNLLQSIDTAIKKLKNIPQLNTFKQQYKQKIYECILDMIAAKIVLCYQYKDKLDLAVEYPSPSHIEQQKCQNNKQIEIPHKEQKPKINLQKLHKQFQKITQKISTLRKSNPVYILCSTYLKLQQNNHRNLTKNLQNLRKLQKHIPNKYQQFYQYIKHKINPHILFQCHNIFLFMKCSCLKVNIPYTNIMNVGMNNNNSQQHPTNIFGEIDYNFVRMDNIINMFMNKTMGDLDINLIFLNLGVKNYDIVSKRDPQLLYFVLSVDCFIANNNKIYVILQDDSNIYGKFIEIDDFVKKLKKVKFTFLIIFGSNSDRLAQAIYKQRKQANMTIICLTLNKQYFDLSTYPLLEQKDRQFKAVEIADQFIKEQIMQRRMEMIICSIIFLLVKKNTQKKKQTNKYIQQVVERAISYSQKVISKWCGKSLADESLPKITHKIFNQATFKMPSQIKQGKLKNRTAELIAIPKNFKDDTYYQNIGRNQFLVKIMQKLVSAKDSSIIQLYGVKNSGKTQILKQIGWFCHSRQLFELGVYKYNAKQLPELDEKNQLKHLYSLQQQKNKHMLILIDNLQPTCMAVNGQFFNKFLELVSTKPISIIYTINTNDIYVTRGQQQLINKSVHDFCMAHNYRNKVSALKNVKLFSFMSVDVNKLTNAQKICIILTYIRNKGHFLYTQKLAHSFGQFINLPVQQQYYTSSVPKSSAEQTRTKNKKKQRLKLKKKNQGKANLSQEKISRSFSQSQQHQKYETPTAVLKMHSTRQANQKPIKNIFGNNDQKQKQDSFSFNQQGSHENNQQYARQTTQLQHKQTIQQAIQQSDLEQILLKCEQYILNQSSCSLNTGRNNQINFYDDKNKNFNALCIQRQRRSYLTHDILELMNDLSEEIGVSRIFVKNQTCFDYYIN